MHYNQQQQIYILNHRSWRRGSYFLNRVFYNFSVVFSRIQGDTSSLDLQSQSIFSAALKRKTLYGHTEDECNLFQINDLERKKRGDKKRL
jgi:hypothetical protein